MKLLSWTVLKFVRIVERLFSFSLYVSNILYKDSSAVTIYISRPFKVLSMPYWQRNVNHGLSLVMCHFPCHVIVCERSNL